MAGRCSGPSAWAGYGSHFAPQLPRGPGGAIAYPPHMSVAETSRPLAGLPWSVRLTESGIVAPPWIGAGIAAAILVVYFGIEYATGQVHRVLAGTAESHIPMHFRITTTTALLLGYLPVARVYLARWTRRHLLELGSLVAPGHPVPPGPADDPRGSRRWSAAGVLGLLLGFIVIPSNVEVLRPEYWIVEHVSDWILLIPLGWTIGAFFHAALRDARHFSALAADVEPLDLFDLTRLAPFVRQGLRTALLMMILLGITAAIFSEVVIPAISVAIVAVAMLTLATVALLYPVRGIHRRIHEEKHAKLRTIRAQLAQCERAVAAGGLDTPQHLAALPGLVALEGRIDTVREWPFDASTAGRLALYLTLGVGSWLGGAAVERLLDSLLR